LCDVRSCSWKRFVVARFCLPCVPVRCRRIYGGRPWSAWC